MNNKREPILWDDKVVQNIIDRAIKDNEKYLNNMDRELVTKIFDDIIIEHYIELSFSLLEHSTAEDVCNEDRANKNTISNLSIDNIKKANGIRMDIIYDKMEYIPSYFGYFINQSIDKGIKKGNKGTYKIKKPFPVALSVILKKWKYSPYYTINRNGMSKEELIHNCNFFYKKEQKTNDMIELEFSNEVEKKVSYWIIEHIYGFQLLGNILEFTNKLMKKKSNINNESYKNFINLASELQNISSINYRQYLLEKYKDSFKKNESFDIDICKEFIRIYESELLIVNNLRESYYENWKEIIEANKEPNKNLGDSLSTSIKSFTKKHGDLNAIKCIKFKNGLVESVTSMFYNIMPFNILKELDYYFLYQVTINDNIIFLRNLI